MAKLKTSRFDAQAGIDIFELIDSIPAALFVKDAHSRIVLMNQTCEEQWGMSFAELRGTTGSQFFPDDQMAHFLARDREVFASSQQTDMVEPFWNAKLKENRIGHTFKRPLFGPDGKPRFLIGVTIDITEGAKAEAELRSAHEKLTRLYELAPMGIALTDMNGKYIEFNRAFESISGYTREELNELDYWALTPKEYEAQEAEQLASLRQRGSYGPYEKEYIRKDGARIPLNLNGVLIQGSDDQPYIWSIVEDISERKKKDELIWYQANYDPGTGLPNRRLFRDRLDQEIKKARRNISQVAVLFIDLDHFKDINDTFGHNKGDELLVEAGQRIRACVRNSDTVARQGGDEFAVILTQFGNLTHVERIARDIVKSIHAPFRLGDDQGHVSASVGITVYPNDASDVESLLSHADQAMYLAKNQGRDRYAYFTPSMQRRAEAKRTMIADLRLAVERKEFLVYYQPIVDAGTGQIIKAEALARWIHPEKGLIPPIDFIPLAEESGIILDIGEWVLQEAIAAVANWYMRFGKIIEISVNMSPVQFAEGARNEHWLSGLRSLPPASIAIEITESMLLKDSVKVKQRLLDLRNLGVEVSIDDFGTGFSALSYIKKFDIDYLKIDRAFTSGLLEDASDRALTEAIIVMSHKLGIKTIAEGVETPAQRDILVELGADFLQGFLFSPPVPLAQFEAMLVRVPWSTAQ